MPSNEDGQLRIMKWISIDTPDTSEVVTASSLRKTFKHKLAALGGWRRKSRKQPDAAERDEAAAEVSAQRKHHVGLLLDAVRKLKEAGLVESTDAASAGGGHKVLSFKKRIWSEILPNERAISLAKKLRVGQDQFPQVAD